MILDDKTVRVTHRYRQSAETVFDAWLNPAIARKFLFATPTGQMVRAEIDARVGGRFTFTDRRDGEDIDHVGEYKEIDRPRRLVMSFGVPKYAPQLSTLEIDFAPTDDGGCEITLTQHDILSGYLERNVQGWTMILESLERAVS